jgi:hypothetical protein
MALSLALVASVAHLAAARTSHRPTSARAARRSAVEFIVAPRSLGMECGMYLDGVHCQSIRTRPFFAHVAQLRSGGSVTVCSTRRMSGESCDLGNIGERPSILRYGKRFTVGRFRCAGLRTGVRCVEIASGKGFAMTRTSLVTVGGAVAAPEPLALHEFLSPDRKVWCEISAESSFCGLGQTSDGGGYPSGLAQLQPGGKVTICFIAKEAEARLFFGVAQGCLQNWDASAPVLRSGQSTELSGVLCSSAANGITCIDVAGSADGRGFRVSASEAVEVSAD